MKSVFLVFTLLLILHTCYASKLNKDTVCRNEYLKKVLNDTLGFSPFIVLKVQDDSILKEIVVQNSLWWRHLRDKEKISFNEYKEKMLKIFYSDLPIIYNGKIDCLKFIMILSNLNRADSIFTDLGIVGIKATYLDEGRKFNYTPGHISAIRYFFQHSYLVRRDDLEGMLVALEFNCGR